MARCERGRVQASVRGSWVVACLLVIVLLTAAVRIRLVDVPLERDEGEYAYAGQLILQGVPPYRHVYNMKMPGIYAAYALIEAAFGETRQAIHIGLLIVNAVTILLVFLLTTRLYGQVAGVSAAATFAFLSLGQPVQGIFANAEHFVLPPALGGILLLMRSENRRGPWPTLAGGVLLGIAFLTKQHGAAFIVFAGLYLLHSELRGRPFQWKPFSARCLLFFVGVLLPFGLTCLVLWWAGTFDKFWFWTFEYAQEYVSGLPLSDGWYNLRHRIEFLVLSAPLVCVLAGVGLTAWVWNRKARKQCSFVAGFTIFSFLAVCPGLYFRPHYFVFILPALSLLTGIAISSLEDLFAGSRAVRLGRAVCFLVIAGSILQGACAQRSFLFFSDPVMACRTTYGLNPFPESLEIARYIREHTTKDDRIAVIGSEPQIYFYAHRRAATGYIYTYALMEDHDFAHVMQQEMIQEIESARPKYLIFVNIPTSWLARPESTTHIFEWSERYRDEFYEVAGIIDIVSWDQTLYRWDTEAIGYTPKSEFWLAVFVRKP
jgi:hypothetical protein